MNFNKGDRVICSIPTDNNQFLNGFCFSPGVISMFGGQEIAGIVVETDGSMVGDYKMRGVEVVGVFFDALHSCGLGHSCEGAILEANGGQWVYTALLRHEEDDVFDRAYAESALDALLTGGSL